MAILLCGCTATRRLPEGEKLVTKAEVKFTNPESVNRLKRVKSSLRSKSPKLNSKFLGLFRSRLWIYNSVREPKKKKGFRYWLKYKLGEVPALYREDEVKQAAVLMEKYLEDHGYFRSRVEWDTAQHERKVQVVYSVTMEGQYFVRNIILPSDTDEISRIIREKKKRLFIRQSNTYNMDKLKAQRERFATIIRSAGYFDFTREHIYYYVDTTVGNHRCDIHFRVKQPSDASRHVKYYINNIAVYPAYDIDDSITAQKNDTIIEGDYTIIRPEVFMRWKPLVSNIMIKKGEPFSQKNHTYTINHFLDLGIFKFVNIKYRKTGSDSLDVFIYLTPSNTQDVTGEINLSTTSTNFLGTAVSFGYTHRNIFKGGEMLILTGSVSAETQFNTGQSFINTLEVNGRAELGYPRFVIPFLKQKYVSLYYIPRTKFSINEAFQKRIQYYIINSLLADYAYDWRRKSRIRHILTPFSVNSIRVFNTTSAFDEILRQNPALRSSFDDIFIISQSYSFIYNRLQVSPDKSYGYFRGNMELAGNILYPIAKAASSFPKPYGIFGRPFAQYSKFDADARYYMRFSSRHSLAGRLIAGIAIPYGNFEVTPYLKQFFIGGSMSVRAWHLRTLGPGSYASADVDGDDIIFPDQTGDIKLELNLEYRFGIVKFLKGALFADAGNIWLLREDALRPGGDFDLSRFYKEIAIGTGIGLRLDFDFFVIRTDVAFPLRKPNLPENSRWMFSHLDFGSRQWRKDNLIWNIAIGYPF